MRKAKNKVECVNKSTMTKTQDTSKAFDKIEVEVMVFIIKRLRHKFELYEKGMLLSIVFHHVLSTEQDLNKKD